MIMCFLDKITDKDFIHIVETSTYMKDIIKKCGYKKISSKSRNLIKQRICDLNIDIKHLSKCGPYENKLNKISDEKFTIIVKESNYLYEIAKKCGYFIKKNQCGKRLKNKIRKRINDLSINTEHFKYIEKQKMEKYLIVGKNRNGTIKRRLIKEKILKEECVECGVTNIYNGKKLVLHLDHINGNNKDNRIENLRFLCPNCHSQTETYCKNMRSTI
jgi:5-methylcytosine-specific restriction endonuclease McrA